MIMTDSLAKQIIACLCLLILFYSQGGHATMRQYKYLDKMTRKEFNAIGVENMAVTSMETSQIASAFANQGRPVGNLHFVNVSFAPGTFTQIMNTISLYSTLRELYLDNVVNPDSIQGEQEFIAALSTNIELRKITIGHYAGSKGFFSNLIGNALIKCINLCELDLLGNNIDSSAASAIGTLLRNVSSLNTLYLIGNAIDDTGAQIIAAALRENRTLGGLDISYNQITTLGWQAIILALVDNLTLQEIRHSDELSPEQINVLQLMSQRNQLICQLESLGDSLRGEGIERWFLIHPRYNEDIKIDQQERGLLSEIRGLDNEIRTYVATLTPGITIATRLGGYSNNTIETTEERETEQPMPPSCFFFGESK